MQGAAAMAAGVARGPGRGRLHRRDRRAAADADEVDPRHRWPRAASSRETATAASGEAIRTTDAFAEARSRSTSRCRRAPCALTRAGQGRGDDLARASRRCSASSRPTRRSRRRPPTCCSACASSARSTASRVDGQLSTNDTAILHGVAARAACAIEPRVRGRAALRRGARLRCCASSRCRSCATARAPSAIGRVRRPRRPRRRRSTRAARAVANSPLVKAALHGGDPNWGRIAQAVGAALPGTAPLPLDIWIEGVQVCSARRGDAATTCRALAEAVAGRGGRVRASRCPARAPRPRSSSPTSRTTT